MKIKFKNNTSIASRTFYTIILSFLIVILLNAVFFRFAFNSMYINRLEKDRQREFGMVCDGFTGGTETSTDRSLAQYALENETAVLVFDEEYHILDGNFFTNITMLTVKTSDGNFMKMPITYLKELSEGNGITLKAAKLGQSRYYDPYEITSNGKAYYINNSKVPPKAQIAGKDLVIVKTWYTTAAGSKTADRAWLIYNNLKEHFIERVRIEHLLQSISDMNNSSYEKENDHFFIYSNIRNGKKIFFISVNTVGLTGSEANYMRSYLMAFNICMFIMLTIAALYLSRRLSRPTKELSLVARQIAQCDFSARAEVKSKDELGQLAQNINTMADNLEDTMKKVIESANEAKEGEKRIRTILANLAHEFKTPLSIISLYSEVIEAGLYEKEPAYYFDIINKQINDLTRIVDETIQLSKLQTGNWKYAPNIYLLEELVKSAIEPFQEVIRKDMFLLTVHIPDVEVYADGVRIKQVLTNLISNSIKYSDEMKKIAIRAEVHEKAVTVYIINSGVVSQEDLDRIWTRYYRAAGQSKTRLPSEGIGLDIVREILLMHNSKYGVESQNGEIQFYFTLRLAPYEK